MGLAEPATPLLKGELDGIPMHIIHVETRPQAEVGIKLDGIVDEPIWQTLPYYDNLIGSVPATGKPGEYPSEFRVLATEKGLYVSAVLYQPPETINNRFTKRDAQGERDTIGITIDSTGTGTFAYWFILSASGTIQDGKVLPVRRYNTVWDGTWLHKTAHFSEGWSAEMFFPWSMMTLPKVPSDYREIGFAFSRQVSHNNQRLFWPGHPYSSRQFVSALNTMQLNGKKKRKLI
ncbi:MAG: carbohydrate binding family 9 domain-containing protein, partial [Pseudomonadales bacterium]|nr:carbohydrate binding family 9 domain-containing protein [Pseudomonadales bacterium]